MRDVFSYVDHVNTLNGIEQNKSYSSLRTTYRLKSNVEYNLKRKTPFIVEITFICVCSTLFSCSI